MPAKNETATVGDVISRPFELFPDSGIFVGDDTAKVTATAGAKVTLY